MWITPSKEALAIELIMEGLCAVGFVSCGGAHADDFTMQVTAEALAAGRDQPPSRDSDTVELLLHDPRPQQVFGVLTPPYIETPV